MNVYADDDVTLFHGDCVEVMRTLPDCSVDAVVTDPPYGLEFMGKEWDKFSTGRAANYAKGGTMSKTEFKDFGTLPQYVSRPAKRCGICGKQAWSGSPCRCENPQWVMDNSPLHAFQAWCAEWAAEALRVLKPGGHLVAFGGTRTYHRLACAIEDAGFEIRDSIMWQHMEHVFCQCHAVPYSHDSVSREGVRSVRQEVAADDALPSEAQQDVQQSVCICTGEPNAHRDANEAKHKGHGCVCGMRQADTEAPVTPQANGQPDVFVPLQRGATRAGVGEARSQGIGGEEAQAGYGRAEESGMEGRGDVPQGQGQLHRPTIRAVTEVGAPNGPQGRLHHGAPPSDGEAGRSPADAGGSGEPHQPRPEGQPTGEPGTVPNEWRPQTRRGWPLCDWCSKPLAPPVDGGPLLWEYGSGFPKSLDVSKAIDKQRYDREDVYRVTAWIRAARDAAGISNRDIDAAFDANGMGRHWTDVPPNGKQPAVPTLEQVPQLLDVLGFTLDKVPDDIRDLLWTLNGRKGQPGPNWAKREVVGTDSRSANASWLGTSKRGETGFGIGEWNITAPATAAAQEWQGWGTALKPAYEPIVLARKPLAGTVAATVLEHGTGALNIDGCRVGTTVETWPSSRKYQRHDTGAPSKEAGQKTGPAPAGRWPANVILDEAAAAMLDEQSGWSQSPPVGSVAVKRPRLNQGSKGDEAARVSPNGHGDSGGASRFFYTAKAGRDERPNVDGIAHPTVKPLDLMRWLVRLVTPPGGVVLEPFAGSGTTAEACVVEGFRCIAIEREADYLPLIVQRLSKPIERTLL